MHQPDFLRHVEEALSRARTLQQQADWQIKRAQELRKKVDGLLNAGVRKPPVSESARPRQNGSKTR
jgi:hypothetical protein